MMASLDGVACGTVELHLTTEKVANVRKITDAWIPGFCETDDLEMKKIVSKMINVVIYVH